MKHVQLSLEMMRTMMFGDVHPEVMLGFLTQEAEVNKALLGDLLQEKKDLLQEIKELKVAVEAGDLEAEADSDACLDDLVFIVQPKLDELVANLEYSEQAVLEECQGVKYFQ